MTDPCVFIIVRDGNKRIYADRWAGALMQREILWGPEALEEFAIQLSEADADELGHQERGVRVDYDAKQLMLSRDTGRIEIPATKLAFQRLLQTSWPGFEIITCPQGVPVRPTEPELNEDSSSLDDDDDDDAFYDRCATLTQATRAEEGNETDGENDAFEPDEVRAWMTLISKKQRVIQIHMDELPMALLQPTADLGNVISKLTHATTPPENVVTEGMVIDMPAKTVSIWGSEALQTRRDLIDAGWKNWNVQWIDGYRAHCAAANIDGKYMTDAEAIAPVIPLLLSTERFDASVLLSAMGGGLKKTAAKFAGCLYLVVCIPILIFAFFSGQWISALITMAVTLVIFFVIFKLIERKVKKKMEPVAAMGNRGSSESAPASAGPQDPAERKAKLDDLLQQSGFPSLETVMQHCDPDDDMFAVLNEN